MGRRSIALGDSATGRTETRLGNQPTESDARMMSLSKNLTATACGLIALVSTYILLNYVAIGFTAPRLSGAQLIVAGQLDDPPNNLSPNHQNNEATLAQTVIKWNSIGCLLGAGLLALHLCRLARRLSSDLATLRSGVRGLSERRATTAKADIYFSEVQSCTKELGDVSKLLRWEQGRLTEDAFSDSLTGLSNRRALMETLNREVSAAKRTGWPLSVIMVDLDDFKKLNDTYGHQAGDKVLKRAAERMASLVREMDLVARYGGEEFAVVLPRASLSQALEIAWQLCNALRCDLLMIDEHAIKVTASFGVSELHQCVSRDPETLVKRADAALYEAKEKGRNTVVAAVQDDTESCKPGSDTTYSQMLRKPSSPGTGAAIDADTMALMGSTYSVLQVIPDRYRVAHDILQQVAATLECQRLVMFSLDATSQCLVKIADIGISAYEKEKCGQLTDELSEWFQDLRSSGYRGPERNVDVFREESSNEEGSTSLLRIVLPDQNDMFGVIEVFDASSDFSISERQRSLLTGIVLIGTRALRICDTFACQEQHWTSLIEALSRVAQIEEHYKRDHAVRGSKLAVKIAQTLGQSNEEELRLLRVAALLRDIGEDCIPARVRSKKGRLRPSEWELIQKHSRRSAELIGSATTMDRLADIVLHHHEHFDGNGYPDGLSQEEIPLESRILAVADTFVALTSDRPYRVRISDDMALQRILTVSGTQFDPIVVNAFMQHYASTCENAATTSDIGQQATGSLPVAAG